MVCKSLAINDINLKQILILIERNVAKLVLAVCSRVVENSSEFGRPFNSKGERLPLFFYYLYKCQEFDDQKIKEKEIFVTKKKYKY